MSYREKKTTRSALWRFVRFLVWLFLGYLILTHFFISSHAVSSVSMEPGLQPGDLVLATPLVYGPTIPFTHVHFLTFGKPQRGDVVVAIPPYYRASPVLLRVADSIVRFFTLQRVSIIHGDASWEHRWIIKRVLGVPGDTIRMKDFTVYVRPLGQKQFQPEFQYVKHQYQTNRNGLPKDWSSQAPFSGNLHDVKLGPDQYFLVGDNRVSSVDSRYFGTVRRSDILEKVIIRYYPFQRFSLVH